VKIDINQRILSAHEAKTAQNKQLLASKRIVTINLMGSPGAGKTSLLEGVMALLRPELRVAVIEGDLFTTKDAERVAALGIPAVQINTRGACHLDGSMMEGALSQLDLAETDLLIIENIGNLVCPAEFDLGEDFRLCLLSVTEGEDKISKYPLMFKDANAVVLNKIDLLPYVDFDREQFYQDLRLLNPAATILELSCRTAAGLTELADWIKQCVAAKRQDITPAVIHEKG
jgi:hydrogenase nickel incorporation protein HypB